MLAKRATYYFRFAPNMRLRIELLHLHLQGATFAFRCCPDGINRMLCWCFAFAWLCGTSIRLSCAEKIARVDALIVLIAFWFARLYRRNFFWIQLASWAYVYVLIINLNIHLLRCVYSFLFRRRKNVRFVSVMT